MLSTSIQNYQCNYQSDQQQQSFNCIFCLPQVQQISHMIQTALFCKYASTQNYYYTKEIDDLIEENLTSAVINFHQCLIQNEEQEFLKRQYKEVEYNKKIEMLSEYYKFHKNIPRYFGLPIQITMGKYYDNRRQFQYKKIKKILKQEQNIQIQQEQNSEQSSLYNHSSYIKKSKYSTMLAALNETTNKFTSLTESRALLQTYQKLNNIIKGKSQPVQFEKKESIYSDDSKKFEAWIKKQQKINKQKIKKFKSIKNLRNDSLKKSTKNFKKKPFFEELNNEKNVLLKNPISSVPNNNKMNKPFEKLSQQQKKYVYNTNINIQIKNALFCNKPYPTKNLLNTLQKKKIVMEDLEQFNNINIKPLIKNFALLNGIKTRSKVYQKQKSIEKIEKIYGIQLKPNKSSKKIKKMSFDTKRDERSSKQKINSKFQTKSTEKVRTLQTVRHSFKKQQQKEQKQLKLRAQSKSKSVPFIKIGQLPKQMVPLKNTNKSITSKQNKDGGFSSKTSNNKQKIQKLITKKLQIDPLKSENRLKVLV